MQHRKVWWSLRTPIASRMRVPRIMWLCTALAFCLILFTYMNAFNANPASKSRAALYSSETVPAEREETAAAVVAAAAAIRALPVSRQEALQVAARATARTLAPGSAMGRNVSAPVRAMDTVPASAATGRLAPGCSDVQPDAERRQLLQMVPAALSSDAGGRPGCLVDTPICAALRHALARPRPGKRAQLLVTAAASAQVSVG